MNKKILVLTMSQQQSNFEVTRLVKEAAEMGVEVNRALYKDLSFMIENGQTKVLVKDEEVNSENTLAVWFRVAGTKTGKYVEARNLAISLLQDKIFCTNSFGYLNWPRMGKISQHGVFVENDISVIPTKVLYTKDQVKELLKTEEGEMFGDWELPIICKFERGYQGKSVIKFDSIKEIKKWLKRKNEKSIGLYLWQKCIPNTWDIRVIVLGGKTLGAMKRSAHEGEFRSNFSLGGMVEAWNLSENDKLLAERVAKVSGLDYCGVDIIKDNEGKSYILEVNRQCQFQGFEKSTGINVAKNVVEMLLERSKNYEITLAKNQRERSI